MKHQSGQPQHVTWIGAVLVAVVAWLGPAAALTSATGTVVPTVASSVRNDANQVITKAQWEKTDVHVHVVVSGSSGTPTGNVQVRVFQGNLTCAGSVSSTIGLVLSNGAIDAPLGTPVTIGPFSFRAVYQGNATYAAKGGACLPLTVIKQKPVVKTTVRDANGTAGTVFPTGVAVHDTGTVTGVGGTPTDVVYVTSYTDAACTNVVGLVAVASLTNGSFNAQASDRLFSKPGTRSYRAEYKGDAHFQDVVGACEPFTIKAKATIDQTVRDANEHPESIVPAGTPLHDFVSVTGAFGTPTGQVTVDLYYNHTCAGAPLKSSGLKNLSGGAVNLTGFVAPDTVPGPYAFRASYSGNGTYLVAGGSCVQFTVLKYPAALVATVQDASGHNVSSVPAGTAVHIHGVVTGSAGTPTGKINATSLQPGCTGLGVVSSAVLNGGSANITPVTTTAADVGKTFAYAVGYSGDAMYSPAGPACVQFTVTAASSTPKPATPPPAATTSPTNAEGQPTSPPSGSPSGGPASAGESPTASSTSVPSAGPTTSAPASTPGSAGASGADPTILAVAALLLVLILIGVFLVIGRRRTTPG